MQNIHDLNNIQARIIRELFTREALRFSELNTLNVSSDQFSYHVRTLIKQRIIEKVDDQKYALTSLGKSKAILLDEDSDKFIRQGYIALRIVATRGRENKTEHLMQQRIKVPFRGYLAEPGGKILYGEDILEAAKRNFMHETGLLADFEVKGLVHYKDVYRDDLVQDKYFFVVRAQNISGELKENGSTGYNIWIERDELLGHSKVHAGVAQIIEIAELQKSYNIVEETFVTEEY